MRVELMTMAETVREARVVQYGCLDPIEGGELVHKQMRAAHRYQNSLIALERVRRLMYRELRNKYIDLDAVQARYLALANELSGMRQAITAERHQARRRDSADALAERAREVHADLKHARGELKAARAAVRDDPAFKTAVAELDERSHVLAKALRGATECYWGSYLLVEASMDQARKAAIDPSFRRWTGEGRIGVQIQGGMSVQTLFSGEDTRLRIDPVPADAWTSSARSVRRKVSRTLLSIRVGSNGRAPIWARFPLVMHRPIPPNATIKAAVVRLRVIGTAKRWSVSLTYTHEAPSLQQRGGTVALDLGWRKRPDASLRVAYWVDDAGDHGEISMPASVRARLRHADGLRKIQDINFNRAIAGLRRWLAIFPAERLPPWLDAERARLGQWRSHERLARLVWRWKHQRFSGDVRIYDLLERWRRKSRHLNQWEANERDGALAHRREVYRVAASKIARCYGTVVLEDFELSKLKRLPAPEEGPPARPAQRAQLHDGAPAVLRQTIEQAATREGGLIVKLSAMGTTSHCHACGGLCAWDQAVDLCHECEHCGARWDQDHNAALNLLHLFVRQRTDDLDLRALARKSASVPKYKTRQRVSSKDDSA
jgi:hypothetical protein